MMDADALHDRTRAYWDAVAEVYLARFRDELDGKPYDRAVLARFAARIGSGGRVWDLGCGPCAHTTRLLADAGLRVTGIDLSPRCVQLARAAQPGLRIEVGDMGRLAAADGTLDGALAYHAILNTPKAELPAMFAEWRRALRPGGVALVVAKEGDGEGLVPDPLGVTGETWLTGFHADELCTLLRAGGLAPEPADTREAYASELPVRRIYVIAQAPSGERGATPR